jgi:hypothetical protein
MNNKTFTKGPTGPKLTKIQLLDKELKQLTVKDQTYQSYQTELNQARETYTEQDKKFKEATLHIALAFEKISILSTDNFGSKSSGLAEVFIKQKNF